MLSLQAELHRAWLTRSALHADPLTTAYRLFHGYGEGHPGLEIDRYGEVAVVASRGIEIATREAAAKVLLELHPFSCVVDAPRGGQVQAIAGTMPSEAAIVLEAGLRYSTEVWSPRNPGLYLDARPARAWLRENSEGRRILNLFSYAGSLGVAAMAGGALSVTHVDTQKRALSRCAANHRLNEQRIDARDLVRMDVTKYLRSLSGNAEKRPRCYGGAIIDAPPLPSHAQVDAEGLSPIGLARSVCQAVEVGGWILVFFHHDARSWDALEEAFCQASACKLLPLWRSQSGLDFPQLQAEQDLRLSVFGRQG